MNHPFNFDQEKTIEVILYIASKVPVAGFHCVSKVMYFADKAHLEKYGRFISGDNYIAMKHGPVPSNTYDILKGVRGDGFACLAEPAKNAFSVENHYVIKPFRKVDLDYFSDSDLECLDEAINEYGSLPFNELTQLSHDRAWESADENDNMGIEQIILTFSNPKPLLDHLNDPYPD